MFSATEDMPDDHRSAQEAGADRDSLGGGLNLALSSGLRPECFGTTALSPTGSQTGVATMTITKISRSDRAHHGTATVPMR